MLVTQTPGGAAHSAEIRTLEGRGAILASHWWQTRWSGGIHVARLSAERLLLVTLMAFASDVALASTPAATALTTLTAFANEVALSFTTDAAALAA